MKGEQRLRYRDGEAGSRLWPATVRGLALTGLGGLLWVASISADALLAVDRMPEIWIGGKKVSDRNHAPATQPQVRQPLRDVALRLLASAHEAADAADWTAAIRLAEQAEQLDVFWNPGEETPAQLLATLRHRSGRVAPVRNDHLTDAASSTDSQAASHEESTGQATAAIPRIWIGAARIDQDALPPEQRQGPRRESALRLLNLAREAADQQDWISAIGYAESAADLGVVWQVDEVTPEELLSQYREQQQSQDQPANDGIFVAAESEAEPQARPDLRELSPIEDTDDTLSPQLPEQTAPSTAAPDLAAAASQPDAATSPSTTDSAPPAPVTPQNVLPASQPAQVTRIVHEARNPEPASLLSILILAQVLGTGLALLGGTMLLGVVYFVLRRSGFVRQLVLKMEVVHSGSVDGMPVQSLANFAAEAGLGSRHEFADDDPAFDLPPLVVPMVNQLQRDEEERQQQEAAVLQQIMQQNLQLQQDLADLDERDAPIARAA